MLNPTPIVEDFDETRALAFMDQMGAVINSGAISVMLSVGHRSGLFEIMNDSKAETAEQIARTANLNARYVREWLSALAVSNIVEFDPARQTFRLPKEHAACLTRTGILGNMAGFAQAVPVMGAIENRILECLETGEGTTYADYPCFHSFMVDAGSGVLANLFDGVLPLVPGLHERLSNGIDVMDAGCGMGRILNALAKRYPQSRFTGYDLCEDVIDQARREAANAGVTNVRFEARDLTGYHEPKAFDLVTSFDAVHDQQDPFGLVKSMYTALKPGGVYLMQDVGGSAFLENNYEFPFAPFLYSISLTHCTPVSIGQGGPGLGTMWGWETAEDMLEKAGFSDVKRSVLEFDPLSVWFVSQV